MFRRNQFRSLYVVLLCLPLMAAKDCDCTKSTSPQDSKPVTHPSKLVVALTGKYADIDNAVVFVDGASWGKIDKFSPVSKEVPPGDYNVKVTTEHVPTTFTGTVHVDESQTKTFNIPLEASHITIITDAGLLLQDVTAINISAGATVTSMVPGEKKTIDVRPEMNGILFASDQNGKRIAGENINFLYDMRYTWTISK